MPDDHFPLGTIATGRGRELRVAAVHRDGVRLGLPCAQDRVGAALVNAFRAHVGAVRPLQARGHDEGIIAAPLVTRERRHLERHVNRDLRPAGGKGIAE